MTPEKIAYKFVHGLNDALTDSQEKKDMAKEIQDYAEQYLQSKLVINKKELLCAFFKFFRDNGEANIGMTIEQFVDAFLIVYYGKKD